VTELFRKNHGGGDNGTRQSTAASLIDPGNTSHANGAEPFLITKSATPIRHRQNLSADCADFHRNFLNGRLSPEICVNLWIEKTGAIP
jgi:hypothetical protein